MISQNIPLMMIILLLSYHGVDAQNIVIAHPGLDVELLCDVTGAGLIAWRINGSSPTHTLNDLSIGLVANHNINGRNILVEDIMMNDIRNGSQYQCVILQNPPNLDIEGNITILYVAGVPNKVPNITVDNITISDNGSNVTLTLSWGEPFNNLDPIVNYTVSCSDDDTCPPNFTTTDNTTRSYTITNLTPMTNYIFSVVATNSIGDSENCPLNYTTEAIDQVMGVDLTCGAEKFNNLCNVTWNQITQDDIIGYQVYYNETMMTVNSSTTTLTFAAPLLPDDVFTGTVVVTVAAISTLGVGPSSLDTAEIYGSSITNVTVAGSFNVTTRLTTNDSDTDVYISYTIAVTDIISNQISSVISNMTLGVFIEGLFSNMTHRVLSSGENFTLFLNSSNCLIELSVLGTNSTNSITADLVTADMVNVTVVDIEENYNMSVTCNIHPKSMADMCMVVAMDTDNNIAEGIAPISNNMANVMLTGLNCSEEYTIIAGGIIMLDGSLFGPKSYQGTIYAFTCDSVSEAFGQIFNETRNRDELSTGAAVVITFVVTFIITLVITALITYIITSLYYKHLSIKSAVNGEGDSHVSTEDIKRRDPTYATASGNITMDTNPAYGTTATIKMDTNPAYATTSH